jgi:hypothetical protein
MSQITPDKNAGTSTSPTLALGFWSAVLVTLFNITSSILMIPSWFRNPITPWRGIETYAATFDPFQIASMLPGLLVVMPFLPLMAAIHFSSRPDQKVFTMLGIAFAGISVGMLGFQYYSQITVIRYNLTSGELPSLGLFVIGNPHSFFWPIEALGYGFMGMSTLFAAFAFSGNPLARWIRFLFLTGGVLGMGGILAVPFEVTILAMLSGLALWTVVFPASTILLAINFKKRMQNGACNRSAI